MTAAIFLTPGDLYSGAEPAVVSTILGSCVAVCLWDHRSGRGGMNHFLLPRCGASSPTPRYGDVAINHLVEEMERLGSRPANLCAKVFGGAMVLPFGLPAETVGAQNVNAALDLLRSHRIPVLTRRTGGQRGLLIRFHTRLGWVMVRELKDAPAPVSP
jgi:chemotaxis protein CheD